MAEVIENGEVIENQAAIEEIERQLSQRFVAHHAPSVFAPNTLQDFDAKLKRHEESQRKVLPSFDDMLGTPPKSFERTRYTDDVTRTFYPLPPKLSALSALMAGVQAVGFGELGESLLIMQLAATYLYTDGEEAGTKRQATPDEVEEFLGLDDLDMLKAMNQKFLNVVMKSDPDPKP